MKIYIGVMLVIFVFTGVLAHSFYVVGVTETLISWGLLVLLLFIIFIFSELTIGKK